MKSTNILFIEEDANDYLESRQLLDNQNSELQIDWAPNYEIALTRVKQNHYDVCLIGYHAKVEQTLFLKHLSQNITIPIILLTKEDGIVEPELLNEYHIDFLDKAQLSWMQLERSIRYLSNVIALEDEEKKFQTIFDKAFEFMALVKPNGIVQNINQTALKFLGTQREAVEGSHFWALPWATSSEKKTQGPLQMAIASAGQGHFAHCEVEVQKHNGPLTILDFSLTPVTNAQGKTIWILAEGRDLSERRALEQQLIDRNLHDQLTGLPNRQLFMNYLDKALIRAKQQQKSNFAVLFLDVDRFKVINISLGHDMGDWLLMEIAQRLQVCLNNKGILARAGGDEFLILLEDISDLTEANRLAVSINKILAKPFLVDRYKILTSASIGIVYHTSQQEGMELLRDADAAMYRAKALGKSGYAIFSPGMREEAISRLQIEMDLHQAIVNKNFVLFYQPQTELYSNQLVGIESLIRFYHPQNGLILPVEFLPVLEDTGIIIPIGEWILQTACHQLKTWLDAGLLIDHVAVNLSAYQFRSKHLVKRVADALENSGIPPESLELEITESLLLKDIDSAIKTLKSFKDMGIRVIIDDFGMGYASLDYIKRFPADGIKIDNSFISGIISSPEDATITVATIDMAHALGLTVVAEGVETVEQHDFLRDHGCDLAQGRFYAAPMKNTAFLEWSQKYQSGIGKRELFISNR
jgi:diguanylate cyclase (GGDEF)-like protein/PAS domain S-box-containing protein